MRTLLHPPVSSQIPGKAALPGFAAAIPTMRWGATSRSTGIPKVTSDMTPKNHPPAGEPACAETARAGVHMRLPTAPSHSPLTPYHGAGQGVPAEEGLTHGGWRRWVTGSGALHGAVLSGRPALLCPPRVTAWTFSCAGTLSPPPDLPVWGIHWISLIPASPGAEPPPGPPHQGYHGRTWQMSDAWAPVVRVAQHHATKAAGHSQEPSQHHRQQCTITG